MCQASRCLGMTGFGAFSVFLANAHKEVAFIDVIDNIEMSEDDVTDRVQP